MAHPSLPLDFIDRFHSFAPPPSLLNTLAIFQDPSLTPKAFIPLFHENQLLEDALRLFSKEPGQKRKWDEEEEDGVFLPPGEEVHRLVRALGKRTIRNFIFSVHLHKTFIKNIPRKKSPSHKPWVTPGQDLTFALAGEDYAESRRLAYSDMSFILGLLYDWLSSVIKFNIQLHRTLKPTLDQCWKESLLAGHIAVKMGAVMKDLRYGRFLFCGAGSLPLGNYLMAWFFNEGGRWNDFLSVCRKSNTLAWLAQERRELKRFGICGNELTGLFLSYTGFLKKIERSVFFANHPYDLKSSHPDHYRLAVLLYSAHTLARQLVSGSTATALPSKTTRWLQGIGFPVKQLNTIITSVQKERAKA